MDELKSQLHLLRKDNKEQMKDNKEQLHSLKEDIKELRQAVERSAEASKNVSQRLASEESMAAETEEAKTKGSGPAGFEGSVDSACAATNMSPTRRRRSRARRLYDGGVPMYEFGNSLPKDFKMPSMAQLLTPPAAAACAALPAQAVAHGSTVDEATLLSGRSAAPVELQQQWLEREVAGCLALPSLPDAE